MTIRKNSDKKRKKKKKTWINYNNRNFLVVLRELKVQGNLTSK